MSLVTEQLPIQAAAVLTPHLYNLIKSFLINIKTKPASSKRELARPNSLLYLLSPIISSLNPFLSNFYVQVR